MLLGELRHVLVNEPGLEQQRKAGTFRDKMGSQSLAILDKRLPKKAFTLQLEDLGKKAPFTIDARLGKVFINNTHPIFRKLKPGEKEIVEAFLIAVGIGKERSGGDVDRMLEEIFKIAGDLLESRWQR